MLPASRRRTALLAPLLAGPFLLGAAAAPVSAQQPVLRFEDPAITESSGLVLVDGHFATTNDSGDDGRIFSVGLDGRTLGVTHWSIDGEAPRDVEALAPAGAGAVWAGDIGDNRAARARISVVRVPVGPGERTVRPQVYDLVYPDGPHDAESLLVSPVDGRLYVATKGVLGGRLWAAPRRLSTSRPNRLHPLGPVLPLATDGAFLRDGRHLVIRNYTTAAVYALPSLQRLGSFALPSQEQGEGLAVGPRDTLFLSSEGSRAPVLQVALPAAVRQAVAPRQARRPSGGASIGPSGGASIGPSGGASNSPSGGASIGPSGGASIGPSAAASDAELVEAQPVPEPVLDRPLWPWLVGGVVLLAGAGALERRR